MNDVGIVIILLVLTVISITSAICWAGLYRWMRCNTCENWTPEPCKNCASLRAELLRVQTELKKLQHGAG
jgi:hypothetical protein